MSSVDASGPDVSGSRERQRESDGGRSRTRLDNLHRVGAVVFGVGLSVFGALGFAGGLDFFSTSGKPVLGLSTNGALSLISLVVAVILVGAGFFGGRIASTVLVVVGAAFVLSGLANTLVLGTSLNLLAFRIPNVIFSFVAGALLLFLGAWGRFTGRLPDDNPYRGERQGDEQPEPPQKHFEDPANAVAARELAEAERAVAQRVAGPEVVARVQAVRAKRGDEERIQEWRRLRG
jgi:hypothetical protein